MLAAVLAHDGSPGSFHLAASGLECGDCSERDYDYHKRQYPQVLQHECVPTEGWRAPRKVLFSWIGGYPCASARYALSDPILDRNAVSNLIQHLWDDEKGDQND